MQQPDINIDNFGLDGDEFYAMLMQAHNGLSEDQSHALNIRLVLLMANQIGDKNVLEEIIRNANVKSE